MARVSDRRWSLAAAAALIGAALRLPLGAGRRPGERTPTAPTGPRSPTAPRARTRRVSRPRAEEGAGPRPSSGAGRAAPGSMNPATGPGPLPPRGRAAARILASNIEAVHDLDRAVPVRARGATLATTAWSADDVTDGISTGLYLRGAGDPTLSTAGLAKLAARVRAAGSDERPGAADLRRLLPRPVRPTSRSTGSRRESVGTLSALVLDSGGTSDPAQTAAQRFVDAAAPAPASRSASSVTGAATPSESAGARQVAELDSPTHRRARPLDQRPLEQLPRGDAAQGRRRRFGGGGSTAGGVAVVRRFAAERGARLQGGERLRAQPANRASPASVGRLLDSMLEVDERASQRRAAGAAAAPRRLRRLARGRRPQRHPRPPDARHGGPPAAATPRPAP